MMRPCPTSLFQKLCRDASALALTEFALSLPLILLLAMSGAELTNYITTKMRISQLALAIADNAARMGKGSQLSAKTVGESDINDVFSGAQMQSGSLDIQTNGRMILTDLEPIASPNTTNKYFLGWQRCFGSQAHPSQYGLAAAPASGKTVATPPSLVSQQLNGIGPAGHQVTAQDGNATMFAEVYLIYKPLFSTRFLPSITFDEYASMAVRDRRDLTKIVNDTTGSSCS